jgi:hypothetical protein
MREGPVDIALPVTVIGNPAITHRLCEAGPKGIAFVAQKEATQW